MARKRKCKVFVSYSRHDEALVRPLAGLLGVAADDAVFLDVTSLKPGELWEKEIFDALSEASVFILCWCCQSQASKNVAKEIAAALSGPNKKLVPVLFCEAPLPPELAERQWTDLRGKVVHVCPVPHLNPTDSFVGRKTTNDAAWSPLAHSELKRVDPISPAPTSRGPAKLVLASATALVLIIGLLLTLRPSAHDVSNPSPTAIQPTAPTTKSEPAPGPQIPEGQADAPNTNVPYPPTKTEREGAPESESPRNFSMARFIFEVIGFVVIPAILIAVFIRYLIALFVRKIWRPLQDRDQRYTRDVAEKAKSYFEGLAAK